MKVCDICQKNKQDTSFSPGEDVCKACKRDLEKFDKIGGIFEEELATCLVCGKQKHANPSNFKGSIRAIDGEFKIQRKVCIECIEKAYVELDKRIQTGTKKCNKCGRELPNTTVYFVKDYRQVDFIDKTCKECKRTTPTEKIRDIIVDGELNHRCRECGKTVRRTDFPTLSGRVVKRCNSCVEKIRDQIENGRYIIKELTCPKCGKTKELNLKNFIFRADCKNYVKPHCRECTNGEHRAINKKRTQTRRK